MAKSASRGGQPKLDDIDRKIIDEMMSNARISNAALAKQVGLSESATLERVRRLEKSGVVLGYTTRIAPEFLGHNMAALVTIRLRSQSHDHIEEFEAEVRRNPNILNCITVTGSCDYVAYVAAEDVEGLDHVLTDGILRLKAVERTESMFVLKNIKNFSDPTSPEA